MRYWLVIFLFIVLMLVWIPLKLGAFILQGIANIPEKMLDTLVEIVEAW